MSEDLTSDLTISIFINFYLLIIPYYYYYHISVSNISHIIVIINSLHTAKRIFNSLIHPYQVHLAMISCEL